MISEKAPLRTGEIGFYPNDKKAIERVFRHVRCNDRFNAFWDELTAQPDISYQLSGRTLFKPDMIYEFFREHGFSGYFEKQRLRTWEEVVYFIDDREDYYRHKYPCGLDRRNKNIS